MLTLVNTNRMTPPIAPVALDYLGDTLRVAGIEVSILDLCLTDDPGRAIDAFFAVHTPRLIGLTFRNLDDCFLASSRSFLGELQTTVERIRKCTDAPMVLGGTGFSLFPQRLMQLTGADYGIITPDETSLVKLYRVLDNPDARAEVPGLLWRDNGEINANPAPVPGGIAAPAGRGCIDNRTYFQRGGQIGFETKRGCSRNCIYCVEPHIKGRRHVLRDPRVVADEIASLLAAGIDVFHTCDSEFNLPLQHARDICAEFIRRGFGKRVRWYAYMTIVPFDAEFADALQQAGCVGINFTSDAANPQMLRTYRQPHRVDDMARVVQLCRRRRIAVMFDMLLGGPGETPETVADTIDGFKRIDPDCAGAALGLRVYPFTELASRILTEGDPENNPAIRRRYNGPIDWMQPTFYLSPALGDQPARLVRELIGDDGRFFPPADDTSAATSAAAPHDHNYNDNAELTNAIANGQRGAYWHILHQLQSGKA